jgi:hypothetical protein
MVTDRNIACSGIPVTYYLMSFGNLVVSPVLFMLRENIKMGYQRIILLFNSKYKHNIKNAMT